MQMVVQRQVASSRRLVRATVIIILVLLLMSLYSLHRDLTGTQNILIGLGLFVLGSLWGSYRDRNGELSPTGLTSNFQADSLRRQAMKREPSSPHVDLREYGKPPSANQD